MNPIRRKVVEVQAKLITAWQATPIADLLYRRRMCSRCPHPVHRVIRLDDHGQVFDYCQDCRETLCNDCTPVD